MHPLVGSDPVTFAHALWSNGGVSPSKIPKTLVIAAGILARAPVSAIEHALMARRLAAEDMPAPIFIVGHWRSGTTHLYTLMSKGRFGYVTPLAAGLPWDMFGIVAALRPMLELMLPAHRYIDNIPITPDSPQEDEVPMANMSALSFYHGIYFPKAFEKAFNRAVFFDQVTPREIEAWAARLDYFLRKVWLHQGRRPLLIKNPAYTGRLTLLARLYPGARFIHAVRNPFEVFVSMRNFYRKLLPQLSLNGYDHIDIDGFVLSTYERLMRQLMEEAAQLPTGSFVEVRYERLDRQPLEEIERVYETLGLPGFETARPALAAHLEAVRDYRKNRFRLAASDIERVSTGCAEALAHWHYALPEPLAANA
ncbi:MAG: sulfotransferase [Geminicoccaceae bacterium]